jgi:hypothetical protein
MFTRVLDLAVLALVAVAVLLPRPDVQVQAALKLDPDRMLRVAELEAELAADPGELAGSLELADLFLDGHRPDWALATVTRAVDRSPQDFRLHFRRALALADHFEATEAFSAIEKAVALCKAGSSVPCGETERSRLELLHATLERVNGLDMRKDPNAARARIMQALRPSYIPPPRKPADTKKAGK